MAAMALIVNPISGHGAGRDVARKVSQHLQREGVCVNIHETRGPGDATQWVRVNGPEHEACVAIGGDGTLREVIAGGGSKLLVGLIPMGTANVMARELGIPRSPAGATRVLLLGRWRRIDMGLANGRPFLAMVGVGLDAAIVQALSRRRRGPISMASYIRPTLATLARHKAAPLQVRLDGEPVSGPVFGLIVSNTRNYAGLLSVTPGARMDDGWLDYMFQRRAGRRAALGYALGALLRRELKMPLASYGRGRSFQVDASTPVAVQVDGDSLGTTPLEVSIQPARVRILAPSAATGKGP